MKEKLYVLINYLSILFFWLISGFIFKYDEVYYKLLKLPSFTLSNDLIILCWLVVFICVALSIFKIMKNVNIIKKRDYLYVLITSYLSNQLYKFFFFTLKSPFLGFVIAIICFISTIFLFIETRNIKKKASYFVIPYLVFNTYSLILSATVFIMNF